VIGIQLLYKVWLIGKGREIISVYAWEQKEKTKKKEKNKKIMP